MSAAIAMPNRKLAEAMMTAGCPFADPEDNGPALNIYTPARLRNTGLLPRTSASLEAFEKAVIQAAHLHGAGDVVFFFKRTGATEAFIQAWDKTADAIRLNRQFAEMSETDRATLQPPPALPDYPDEVIAQILCIHANNLKAVRRAMFANSPVCNALEGTHAPSGEPTATGVAQGVTTGSGKVWSVDLPNEERAKMGIHPRLKP